MVANLPKNDAFRIDDVLYNENTVWACTFAF